MYFKTIKMLALVSVIPAASAFIQPQTIGSKIEQLEKVVTSQQGVLNNHAQVIAVTHQATNAKLDKLEETLQTIHQDLFERLVNCEKTNCVQQELLDKQDRIILEINDTTSARLAQLEEAILQNSAPVVNAQEPQGDKLTTPNQVLAATHDSASSRLEKLEESNKAHQEVINNHAQVLAATYDSTSSRLEKLEAAIKEHQETLQNNAQVVCIANQAITERIANLEKLSEAQCEVVNNHAQILAVTNEALHKKIQALEGVIKKQDDALKNHTEVIVKLLNDVALLRNPVGFGITSIDIKNPINTLMVKESLRKYRYVLDKEYSVDPSYVTPYPDRIWLFWDNGFESAPKTVKLCVESIKKYAEGRTVELLDATNFDKYVTIPDYIVDRFKNKEISPHLFSDVLRVTLLRDHGGIWMDASTYLTAPLPNYITEADFWAPIYSEFDPQHFYNYRSNVIIPNFFLTANKPHHYFFQCFAEFFSESLKELHNLPYFSAYAFGMILMEESGRIMQIMHDLCSDENRKTERMFWRLHRELSNEFKEETWNKLKEEFPIHKLSAQNVEIDIKKGIKPNSFLEKFLNEELV